MRRKQTAQMELVTERVKFIQIISVSYTYGDDKDQQGSSVVALGDDGVVYQYRRGEINAWVPFNSDIFRRV